MKNLNPLVTVLMPLYNGEKYIEETMKSILFQSYKNFELLIIDDGSTDNSINKIKMFSDKRINFIKNNNNIGQTKTLNKGIRLAKGKYIARIDQDDVNHKERLDLQVKYLEENPEIALIGTSINFIDHKGEHLINRESIKGHTQIINYFCVDNQIPHSSAIFRRNIAIQLNGYSENYKICQDFEFWIRLAKHFKIDNLKETLVSIRIHDSQSLKNRKTKKNHFIEIINSHKYLLNNHILNYNSKILVSFKILIYSFLLDNTIKGILSIFLFIFKNIRIIINKYFWLWILNKSNFQLRG